MDRNGQLRLRGLHRSAGSAYHQPCDGLTSIVDSWSGRPLTRSRLNYPRSQAPELRLFSARGLNQPSLGGVVSLTRLLGGQPLL
jgi:hypothetical protein